MWNMSVWCLSVTVVLSGLCIDAHVCVQICVMGCLCLHVCMANVSVWVSVMVLASQRKEDLNKLSLLVVQAKALSVTLCDFQYFYSTLSQQLHFKPSANT